VAKLIAELSLAPGLVAAATIAGDRWGQRVAGLVSGLPVVVGPLLLIADKQRGAGFAATAANSVLLGLPALGGFALAYARAARRGPGLGLLSGWGAAAALAALIWLCPVPLPFPAGLVFAAISVGGAFLLLPRSTKETRAPVPERSRPVSIRMAATAALALLLWAALAVLGPTVGGVLAALPTIVSVLVFFVHRECGADAAVSLLHGALAGMVSFVVFCAVVAWMLTSAGLLATFFVGAALGVCLQGAANVGLPGRAEALLGVIPREPFRRAR
jgi:hypothetical protein